jgi:hypothetical protein
LALFAADLIWQFEVKGGKGGVIAGASEVEVALGNLCEDVTVRVLFVVMPKRLAVPVRENTDRKEGVGRGQGGRKGSAHRSAEVSRLVLGVKFDCSVPRGGERVKRRAEKRVTLKGGGVPVCHGVDVEGGGKHFCVDTQSGLQVEHGDGRKGPMVTELD